MKPTGMIWQHEERLKRIEKRLEKLEKKDFSA